MPRLHAEAKEAARQAFLTRRMLTAPEQAAERLDRLLQELDNMLPSYIRLNEVQTQKLIAESQAAYEACIGRVAGAGPLCLHPLAVQDVHADAAAAATAAFDAGRQPPGPGEEDEERTALFKALETKLSEATATNDQSNTAAASQARELYSSSMQNVVQHGAVSSQRMRSEHESAKTAARNKFAAKRSCTSQYPDSDDHFLSGVLKYIEEQFDYMKSVNNKNAQQVALNSYNNHMSCVQTTSCMHPDSLQSEHEKALRRALEEFRTVEDDKNLENNIQVILQQK